MTQPILEIGGNVGTREVDTKPDTWARDLVHGKTISPLGSQFEWTQVNDPDGADYEGSRLNVHSPGFQPWIGLSGTVFDPRLSGDDNAFLHPFGDDWEFFIAPDPQFDGLTARSLTHNQEYVDALAHAKAALPGFNGRNVLGVEVERDLVPEPYRVQNKDRVCVWGRWIVDTGHDDFHTEIHPPLLLVAARPIGERSTYSTIVGRPYLISQRFGDGPLLTHMEKELAKVETPIPFIGSTQVEAHPTVMPKPFKGKGSVNYVVRPPTPRPSPTDVLMARFHFTVRSGIDVMIGHAGDAVEVFVSFDDERYHPAPLPKKHDRIVNEAELKKENSSAGTAFYATAILDIFVNPIAAAFLQRGIKTDRYDPPLAQSAHDKEVTRVPVDSLPPSTSPHLPAGSPLPYVVDDYQPFPIYGYLALEWQAAAVKTLIDLNGKWAYGGVPGPVISVAGAAIAVDMSAYHRPPAHGSILDSSNITVTFPDVNVTTSGKLQSPNTIKWSNNTVWTKV